MNLLYLLRTFLIFKNTCFEKYKVRKEYKINDPPSFSRIHGTKYVLYLKQIRNVLSVRNFNHVIATLISYMILYIIINIDENIRTSYIFKI